MAGFESDLLLGTGRLEAPVAGWSGRERRRRVRLRPEVRGLVRELPSGYGYSLML